MSFFFGGILYKNNNRSRAPVICSGSTTSPSLKVSLNATPSSLVTKVSQLIYCASISWLLDWVNVLKSTPRKRGIATTFSLPVFVTDKFVHLYWKLAFYLLLFCITYLFTHQTLTLLQKKYANSITV